MAKIRSTREIVIWSEVAEILNRKIEGAITASADATDLRSMGRAQGQLAAYREVLGLPAAMVANEELETAGSRDLEAIQRSQDPRTWVHPDYDPRIFTQRR